MGEATVNIKERMEQQVHRQVAEHSRSAWTAAVLCLVLLASTSCVTTPNFSEDVHVRALRTFDQAILLKPVDAATENPAYALLPFLLHEVGADPAIPIPGGFHVSAEGTMFLSTNSTVYFSADTVRIGGRDHVRIAYRWYYWERQGPLPQGVRMTLNSAGAPVIWEVLRDTSGQQLIYVARSLEEAAAAEHGPPLPGRRYSVETSRTTHPRIQVVRVLEDGPVPMGPLVYLTGASAEVATVLCRCMPAQARSLTDTRWFSVEPALPWMSLRPLHGSPAPNWPEGRPDSYLRLPGHF